MKNRDAVSETKVKAHNSLPGQGNLRNQKDRLLFLSRHMADQFHIDLGLSAACNSVDQAGAANPLIIFPANGLRNHPLLLIQHRRLPAGCR